MMVMVLPGGATAAVVSTDGWGAGLRGPPAAGSLALLGSGLLAELDGIAETGPMAAGAPPRGYLAVTAHTASATARPRVPVPASATRSRPMRRLRRLAPVPCPKGALSSSALMAVPCESCTKTSIQKR